jgi:hypothetical protein
MVDYNSALTRAFTWYHTNVDRKEARGYIRNYVIAKFGREPLKIFDRIPEAHIQVVMGWLARLVVNGNQLKPIHQNKLGEYVDVLLNNTPLREITPAVLNNKPTVRDYTEQRAKEYIGELEHALDLFITEGKELDLQSDMKARSIPGAYNTFIEAWIKRKAGEFITLYEDKDPAFSEGYSKAVKKKTPKIIKLLKAWLDAVTVYDQFKKANRKPRVKKKKPAGVQIAKLKYKVEDPELKIKSVHPTTIVGAEQVWVYNTKYKKLAAYRSDSSDGIQVKGTSLQNYDPEKCEQKTLRKPQEVLTKLLNAGKTQLRRILSELTTKESPVTGRINEDCLIVRVIK